jgi:hypothetical protein
MRALIATTQKTANAERGRRFAGALQPVTRLTGLAREVPPFTW